jgi:integrase
VVLRDIEHEVRGCRDEVGGVILCARCIYSRSAGLALGRKPVPEQTRAFVAKWWENHDKPTSGPVFPSRRGKRAGELKQGSNSYAYRLRRELWKAGLRRHELHHETDTTLPVDFHSTRRAFGTAMRRSGASDRQIIDAGGWSDARLIERYNRTDAVQVLPESAALPGLCSDGAETLKRPASKKRNPA